MLTAVLEPDTGGEFPLFGSPILDLERPSRPEFEGRKRADLDFSRTEDLLHVAHHHPRLDGVICT